MPLSVTGAPYWTLRTDSRAVPSLAYLRYQNLLTVGTTNAYYSGKHWIDSGAAYRTNSVNVTYAQHKATYVFRCVVTLSNGKAITTNAVRLIAPL